MHGDSDGEATLSSLLVLCVTIAFFGSNFVPIKNVTIKNYAFFQWVMCNAILVTVIPWCLTQGRPVQLHPIAFIGGVAWCCGNYLCPMILDKLGLGVGSLLWGTVEMFVAWLSGTFGILGVERQTIQRPWLNFLGVMVVVAGGIVLAQVSSDTTATTTNDTSEFSALSSFPMDATELSPVKSGAEERKDNEDGGEEASVEMDRIFAASTATAASAALSPRRPTVYQLNPMLDRTSASMNHASTRMRSSRDGNDVTTTTTTTTPGAVSALDWSPPFHSANPCASVARDMHVSTPSSTDSLAKIPSSRATSSSSPSPAAGTGCPPLRSSASPNVTTTSTPIDPLFIHPGTGTGRGLLEDRNDSSVHLLGEHADVEKATTVEGEPAITTTPKTTPKTTPTCPKWLQLHPYEEGIALALVAGALFGLNFNPIQHLVDHSDGQVTAGTLIVSHYVGICYTSYALLLLSMLWSRYGSHTSDPTQPSSAVLVDYECILPAIASGVMWGIGAIAWFVAAESLPISVTFPLISAGPNLVTMTWSLVYFREVRGRRDLGLLSLALTLLGLGLFCVWFSNL